MKLKFVIILVSISTFFFSLSLVFSPSASAAPGNNPIFATMEWVHEQIAEAAEEVETKIVSLTGRVEANETAIQNNQTDLDFLKQRAEDLEEQIADHENRLSELESNSTLEPVDFVFFNGEVSTSGADSPIFDAEGYSKIAFSYNTPSLPTSTGGMSVSLMVSPDEINWFIQDTWSPDVRHVSEIYDVSGRYYKVSTGSTTLPAVAINAFGHFYNP